LEHAARLTYLYKHINLKQLSNSSRTDREAFHRAAVGQDQQIKSKRLWLDCGILAVFQAARKVRQSGLRWNKIVFAAIGTGNYFAGGYNISDHHWAFGSPEIRAMSSIRQAFPKNPQMTPDGRRSKTRRLKSRHGLPQLNNGPFLGLRP
jgi:hypothetical protein